MIQETDKLNRSTAAAGEILPGNHVTCRYCNEDDYHEIIECITAALDARDPYTAGHSQRVSEMSRITATLMGFPAAEIDKIHIAAHLHDIGKIGISDAVLKKQGRLTDEEFAEIKRHPSIGAEILRHSHQLADLSEVVLHHHERYDGKGYPDGLAGTDIPVGARVIAICDSIDAMSSNRCYRSARDPQYVYNEIQKNLGIMYDPIIGQHVLDHWEEITGFRIS